jgi:transcriptional regulator with XRE-family HTH domain
VIEHLGPALQLLRESIGLSQREAALRCRRFDARPGAGARVTQAMLSQWERGAQHPSLASLAALLGSMEYRLVDLEWAMWSVAADIEENGSAQDPQARGARRLEAFLDKSPKAGAPMDSRMSLQGLADLLTEMLRLLQDHGRRLSRLERSRKVGEKLDRR